jgi:hypothetical protein
MDGPPGPKIAANGLETGPNHWQAAAHFLLWFQEDTLLRGGPSAFGAVDRLRGIREHGLNNNAEMQGPRLRNLIAACDRSSLIWETAERVLVAGGFDRQERT